MSTGPHDAIGFVILAAILVPAVSVFTLVAPPVSAISHPPVWIKGDSDFTAQNGVTGGTGGSSDPYIIEGWDILVSQGFGGAGIRIDDTSAHFVVRNVAIRSGGAPETYGIRLGNASNGRIENSTLSGLTWGVGPTGNDLVIARNQFNGGRGIGCIGEFTCPSGSRIRIEENEFRDVIRAVHIGVSDSVIEANRVWGSPPGGDVVVAGTNITIARNVISGGSVYLRGAEAVLILANEITGSAGSAIAMGRTCCVPTARIVGNNLTGNRYGVFVNEGDNVVVERNNISLNSQDGVHLEFAENTTVADNVLSKNANGAFVNLTSSATFVRNEFRENDVGFGPGRYTGAVKIHHNAFVNNRMQAMTAGGAETWDIGYPAGGNYWSDYDGPDRCSGPAQNVCPDPDGIGDVPRAVPPSASDRYPLMARPREARIVVAELTGPGSTDLRLVWTRAIRDGILPGVVNYTIIRADRYDGPYAAVAIVADTGANSYEYVCGGCGHDSLADNASFFRVRAADHGGQSFDGNVAARYSRRVVGGATLLSVPLQQGESSIAVVLQTLSYDRVRTFRPGDPGSPWNTYKAGRGGNIPTLLFGEAFWVNLTAPGTYTVAGLLEPQPTIPLKSGWNLVCYAAVTSRTRSESLPSARGVLAVEAFDASANPYRLRSVRESEYLVTGAGYWVWAAAPITWTQS